eukprot:CAMPEP_0119397316 /NCGR_PEP_ID=MMETSP1334-20130426/140271_1 /TAXON_ID=127549 /ORGANISM="Calcidiscus leptoporus, Strain RCC1130" /LENGTH=103 /DNA_ID=CAMNT_0007421153 /DNA_START=212 /DNA_END=523 /DNA_ORIENTATION=-
MGISGLPISHPFHSMNGVSSNGGNPVDAPQDMNRRRYQYMARWEYLQGAHADRCTRVTPSQHYKDTTWCFAQSIPPQSLKSYPHGYLWAAHQPSVPLHEWGLI